jgi:hypothetical protein
LELDANKINNIENDPKHSMYHHFAQSFIALLSYNDHATVIRKLYQILEDSQVPSNLTKYKYLRDALSHGDRLYKSTLSSIEREFGQNYFIFKEGRIDHDSPVNIRNLRREAWKLMGEVLKEYRKFGSVESSGV